MSDLRPPPRFSFPVYETNPAYDRELVLELLQKLATNVVWTRRSAALLSQINCMTDVIMGLRLTGSLMTYTPVVLSRNSVGASFLIANFPKDHRIWNYIHVPGYSERSMLENLFPA